MRWLRLPGRLVAFAGWFLVQLVVTNVQVTWDVLTPRSRLRPGVVALPLRCRSDAEVALLCGLITLTPGTLALSVKEDPPTMFVHGLYAPDAERFRAELDQVQTRMLGAVRAEGER